MKTTALIGLLLTLALSPALAQERAGGTTKKCSTAEAKRAEEDTSRLTIVLKEQKLKAWPAQLYRSYKTYSACDDGGIAEGYTEAVVQFLANHWASSEDLFRQTKKDGRFEAFVLRHINATADWDDLDKVAANARSSCPPKQGELCKRIVEASSAASKEAKSAAK